MPVTREEVLKVAELARLLLSDDQAARMTTDLNAILDYVEKLNQVDTEGVSPLSWLEGKRTPVEDDQVARFDNIDQALANSPKAEGRFFIVPKVIE